MAFMTAPLAIAGVAGVLAALISVVDSVVNNYGEVTLSINAGRKELPVRGGANLLTTLSAEGIFLPSACGGRGSCGACKCQVKSDIGPHLPTEVPYLTKEEMGENIRLSCQVKVKTDLDLQIPDELFNVKQFQTKIKSIVDVTHDIKEVVFDLQGETVEFTAGMYMQIVVPPHGKIRGTTQRAYSMSSQPSSKGEVELLIRLVPGGIATTYVHEQLQVGQEMELIGPFGEFRRSDTDALMVCVAGGSGMAPFKSILYDMVENGQTDREVWYFFGARTRKDLFYGDMLRELEKKWPKFHYVEALSEPEPEVPWDGATGLITDVLDDYFKTKMPQDVDMEGYLCGSPGMIDACNRVMTKNGVTLDKIYYDKFA